MTTFSEPNNSTVARLTPFSVSDTPHSVAGATHRAGRRSSADPDRFMRRSTHRKRGAPQATTVRTSVQSPTDRTCANCCPITVGASSRD